MRHIVGLDLVRVAAASVVMLFHLAYAHWKSSPPLGEVSYWFSFGWIGVPVFFVISGFVIAYSANEATAPTFLRNRVLRIMPGVVICASIGAALLLAEGRMATDVLPRYLSTLTLSPVGPYVDSVYWTLAVEAQFYALVVVLLLLPSALRRIEWLFSILAIVSAAIWALRAAGQLSPTLLAATRAPIEVLNTFDLGLNGSFFALGGMLWIIRYGGASAWRLAVVLVCAVTGVVSTYASARSFEPQYWSLPIIGLILGIVGILASIRFNEQFTRLPPRTLAVIRTAGLVTYPLYLLHSSVGLAAVPILATVGVPAWLSLIFAILLSIALAVAVHLLMEGTTSVLKKLWVLPKPNQSILATSRSLGD